MDKRLAVTYWSLGNDLRWFHHISGELALVLCVSESLASISLTNAMSDNLQVSLNLLLSASSTLTATASQSGLLSDKGFEKNSKWRESNKDCRTQLNEGK